MKRRDVWKKSFLKIASENDWVVKILVEKRVKQNKKWEIVWKREKRFSVKKKRESFLKRNVSFYTSCTESMSLIKILFIRNCVTKQLKTKIILKFLSKRIIIFCLTIWSHVSALGEEYEREKRSNRLKD